MSAAPPPLEVVELRLTYSVFADIKKPLPDVIELEYRGRKFRIITSITRIAPHVASWELYMGETILGHLGYWPTEENIWYIGGLGANDMQTSSGMSIMYKDAIRPPDRVPVGTILFTLFRQYAKINGIKEITLTAMGSDSKSFYIKQGMSVDPKGSHLDMRLEIAGGRRKPRRTRSKCRTKKNKSKKSFFMKLIL